MRISRTRQLIACALAAAGLTLAIPALPAMAKPDHKPLVLDLETLTGEQAEQLMASGQLTSVELTRAYLDRIDALN